MARGLVLSWSFFQEPIRSTTPLALVFALFAYLGYPRGAWLPKANVETPLAF